MAAGFRSGNAASDKTQGLISYYAGEPSIYQATGRGIRGNSANQRLESGAKLAQQAKASQAFSRPPAEGMAEKWAAARAANDLPESQRFARSGIFAAAPSGEATRAKAALSSSPIGRIAPGTSLRTLREMEQPIEYSGGLLVSTQRVAFRDS